MNPTTHTLTVRGQRVRTRTPRRYAVVIGRSDPVPVDTGWLVPFAQVEKRTDSFETAQATRRRHSGQGNGIWAVIIDLRTGEEVS